jgi:hypothetical protein
VNELPTRHIDVMHDVFKERFLNASLRRHSYLTSSFLRHERLAQMTNDYLEE